MSKCKNCNDVFDLNEGGFVWDGLAFCEMCDPEGDN